MLSIPFILALAAIVLVVRYAQISWNHYSKARQWGCASLPRYPTDFFGLSSLKEVLAADKVKKIPLAFQARLDKMAAIERRPVYTFRIRQMGSDNLFTCDPANVQALLATKFKDFELGSGRRTTMYPFLGLGIFTSDGDHWSRSRAMLRPQFSREQISDLEMEEHHVQEAMRAIPVDTASGWTSNIDIQSIFFRLTIDSATEFLFGESAGSQAEAIRNGGQLPPSHFSGDFDRGQWYAAQRTRYEKFHWLVDNQENRDIIKRVQDYVDVFVQKAFKARAEGKPLSNHYVFSEALAASTQDPVELRSELLNILLAGRDTTASTLSWSILMFARHPHFFHKLRNIVLEDFGPYSKRDNITFASLKACRYLQYTMNEVLRLYPVVPVNRRFATHDTFLPQGGGPDGSLPVYVRAGQTVSYSPFVTQRRRDLWGEDAEEFNPDRWYQRRVGWEHLPFNGGPRVCIGQQFALTEVGYILVRLLQKFDAIENVYPDHEIKYGLMLTMAPGELVTVRLHEAPATA